MSWFEKNAEKGQLEGWGRRVDTGTATHQDKTVDEVVNAIQTANPFGQTATTHQRRTAGRPTTYYWNDLV
jgi:hypothetical protein